MIGRNDKKNKTCIYYIQLIYQGADTTTTTTSMMDNVVFNDCYHLKEHGLDTFMKFRFF